MPQSTRNSVTRGPLFLRPTESLTVYLQQFGRGLRLHDEKDCLMVLDFVGAQRREFRFAPRFRALSTKPTARLDREIEQGELVRARSMREHRSTLLHYVLANGFEDFRQKTPKNIVDLTKPLARSLDANLTLQILQSL